MYITAPITLPPGVVRSSSRYSVNGRYYDTNMVRFFKGKPQRWGGWEPLVTPKLDGPARAALTWRANDGSRYAAFGTKDKLWLLSEGTLYDITPASLGPGEEGLMDGAGFGELDYAEGPWGGAVDPILGRKRHTSTWALAKWGEDLLAVRRGSTLFHWVKASGPSTKAAPVLGAPSSCFGVFTTEDRHAVVYGAHDGTDDDPLRLQWPSQETLTTWTPDATNTAGDLRVDDGNEITASIPIIDGHLILTDISTYTWKYIGGDYVFSKRRLAGDQGIVGPNAGVEFDGDAYWMSQDGFSRYNGRVSPVNCDVHQYVFQNINRRQSFKVFCGTNREFGEIIWFYPDKTSTECNRYVTFQPSTGDWTIGALDRTCWIDEDVLSEKPIAIKTDGTIYRHEVGDLGDGAPIPYLLESGDVDIKAEGSLAATVNHLMLRKIVPDYERIDAGDHRLTILRRDYPQAPAKAKGPYSFNGQTRAYFPRARGMTLSFRFEGNAAFRMGDVMGFVSGSGGR